MAECVNAFAVSIGDCAGSVNRKVSPNQLHAHGRSWRECVSVELNHRPQTRAAADSGDWLNADLPQIAGKYIEHILRNTRESNRRCNRYDRLSDVRNKRRIARRASTKLRRLDSRNR